MATLSIGDLSLEIAYSHFDAGWIKYDIWCRWKGIPVINPAVLRHDIPQRPDLSGCIVAEDHRKCGLLPLLREVLDTNTSGYWDPIEPFIVLALYTDDVFPFLPSNWTPVRQDAKSKAERQEREQLRAQRGPLPDDVIELILFVDRDNFHGSTEFSGDGVCFRFGPTRRQLHEFHEHLQGEYAAFRVANAKAIERMARAWE